MMAGNPSWWSMHSHSHGELRSSSSLEAAASDHDHDHQADAPPNLLLSQTHSSNYSSLFSLHEYLHPSSSSNSTSPPSSSLTSLPHQHTNPHDFPHSWSQRLLGGLASNEQQERFGASVFQSTRVLSDGAADVKQEVSSQSNNKNNNNSSSLYGYNHEEQEAVGVSNRLAAAAAWSQNMPVSSPRSCVTTLTNNNNILDFSTNNNKRSSLQTESTQQLGDHANSEFNSCAAGGVPKKPKIQSSSNPPLKVRKEKLGDRITTLHQLVSPFGKTDIASVLLEAIGYIRFLQAQIQALSSPYLGNDNNASTKSQHTAYGERNCLFPDHPGQLLNDSFLKRRGAANNQEETKDAARDLKSRGLCLVPIACTHLVGSDNGADYWAQMQSLGGGF